VLEPLQQGLRIAFSLPSSVLLTCSAQVHNLWAAARNALIEPSMQAHRLEERTPAFSNFDWGRYSRKAAKDAGSLLTCGSRVNSERDCTVPEGRSGGSVSGESFQNFGWLGSALIEVTETLMSSEYRRALRLAAGRVRLRAFS